MDINIDYSSPAIFATATSIFLAFFIVSRNFRLTLNALFGLLGGLSSCWFFLLYFITQEQSWFNLINIIVLSSFISYVLGLLFYHLENAKTKINRIIPENSIVWPVWLKSVLNLELVFLTISFIAFLVFSSSDLDFSEAAIVISESIILAFSLLLLLKASFFALLSTYRLYRNSPSLGRRLLEKTLALLLGIFWVFFSLGNLVLISKTLGALFHPTNFELTSFQALSLVASYLASNSLLYLFVISLLGILLLFTLVVTKRYFLGYKVIVTQLIATLIAMFNLISILNSGSIEEIILRTILFLVLAFLSHLLVKSVTGEIQKRKQIQDTAQEIFKANKTLHRLDRAKSEFIAGASHQLRSPLSVIKGIGSMLLDGSYGKLNSPIKDAMEKVYISNERLIGLIEDLLDVSHLEEGKVDFNFQKIDVNGVVQKAVDGLSLQAQNKKLYLKFSPWKKSKLLPWMDEQKVTEAVSNLIDNAIKYTRKGGVRAQVKKVGNSVRISVTDTGIGLRKEEASHLFQKFVRAGRGNKMSTVGTGLGLFVVRKMIEAHKGYIWSESKGEGQGSTFIIELPLNLKTPPTKKFIQRIVTEKKPA